MDLTLENLIDELGPILCLSFLGSCIHEYTFNHNNQVFFRNINLWMSTLIAAIISFIIDPFVLEVSPRLILLPPLILGLSGMDLIIHLSTVKGSLEVLKEIFGFIGIKKNTRDSSDNQVKNTDFEEINNLISVFFYLISSVLSTYYTDQNNKDFLKQYFLIKKDYDLLNSEISKYAALPVSSVLAVTTIIKKVIELDTVYNHIIAKSDKGYDI